MDSSVWAETSENASASLFLMSQGVGVCVRSGAAISDMLEPYAITPNKRALTERCAESQSRVRALNLNSARGENMQHDEAVR